MRTDESVSQSVSRPKVDVYASVQSLKMLLPVRRHFEMSDPLCCTLISLQAKNVEIKGIYLYLYLIYIAYYS